MVRPDMKALTKPLPAAAPNIAIIGSTASGKTGLSYRVAELLPCGLICCDSIQMYKGFDIGSAKPTAEEMAGHPHYLFDTLPAEADYDAKAYRRDALAAIHKLRAAGRVPVVVGGTGLYLRALMNSAWHDDLPSDQATRAALGRQDSAELYGQLKAKDPRRAAELHENDRLRVIRALEIIALTGKPASEVYQSPQPDRSPQPTESPQQANASQEPGWWLIHLDPPREQVLANIEARTAQLLADGLVAEVEGLLARGLSPGLKPFASIGYKQVMAQLTAGGAIDEAALTQQIIIATRQYAKRQRTWFRGIADQVTTRLTSPELPPELSTALKAAYTVG